ncbi:Aste57867_19180 [Aphanomyces stellatus]|uniref:Aste57867_19180 protein n=1 Tax=Aphanomyces stellatus TaxID=120398 RepID=A0A485LCT2_9STRA|nr:hypothetical protein As57867_019116 [Aphanomyces stellatus]VFT95902.1 Aste57867_19180 [Aphanomyces stellatus]
MLRSIIGDPRSGADAAKQRKTKACASCWQSFNAFHWRYACSLCDRVVCRNCTFKTSWKKRVCFKCVIEDQCRDVHQSVRATGIDLDTARTLDDDSNASSFKRVHHSPATPTTTATTHEEYTYHESYTVTRSRGQSSVDSFIEDGGLRVSAKFGDDDLLRYSSKFSSRSCDAPILDFDWVHPFPKAPRPAGDAARLDCFRHLDIEMHLPLLTPDPLFLKQVLAAMAQVDAQMGSIHFVADDIVYNVACVGYSPVFEVEDTTDREEAAASHGVLQSTPLVVPDISNDARFRAHPLAVEHNASAYVSVPILVSGAALHKECIGTLDLAFHDPLYTLPALSAVQLKGLQAIAATVGAYVERRCKELNHVHESSRGRRHTAPMHSANDPIVEEGPTTTAAITNETLQSLWDKAMETSRVMRSTLSGQCGVPTAHF